MNTRTHSSSSTAESVEFEKYKKSRREFVQNVAERASRPENITILMNAGVLTLLRPLLLDNQPAIQQTAALALGRLANYSEGIASQIVETGILPEIIAGIASSEKNYQSNCCFVVRTIAKHSSLLAQQCVDAGVLEPLVSCLSSYDGKVRESAAWALGFIASHSEDLAQAVVDANTIQSLIMAVQNPDLTLKRIAVSAIGNIAKHNPHLAQAVIDARAITTISPLLCTDDPKLKQHVCTTLGAIAKHSSKTANNVIEGEHLMEQILECLDYKDVGVRRAAALLIRELSKHTPELAQFIVSCGGAAALVRYLQRKENDPLYALMAIGYIAHISQALASTFIQEGAASVVLDVFKYSPLQQNKAAAAWTLGQLGKHSPKEAAVLVELDALNFLLIAYNDEESQADLQLKTKEGLEFIIRKTENVPKLQTVLERAKDSVQKAVLQQLASILPKNKNALAPFLERGVALVQEIKSKADPTSEICSFCDTIISCFSEKAQQYYSPQYEDAILRDIQAYDV